MYASAAAEDALKSTCALVTAAHPMRFEPRRSLALLLHSGLGGEAPVYVQARLEAASVGTVSGTIRAWSPRWLLEVRADKLPARSHDTATVGITTRTLARSALRSVVMTSRGWTTDEYKAPGVPPGALLTLGYDDMQDDVVLGANDWEPDFTALHRTLLEDLTRRP